MQRKVWFGVGALVASASTMVVPVAGAAAPPARPQASVGQQAGEPRAEAPVADPVRWARAATFDLLGRPATRSEAGTIAGRIAGGTPYGVIARELARSPEWTGNVVTDLYLHVLGREPDAEGLAYWVDRLGQGDRVANVAVSIYGSPEYYATAGSTSEGYVEALYESVLERAPEADGLAYWVRRLDSGTSRWVVARAVFLSFEARAGRVEALYRTLLGRGASADDRTFWAGRLAREDDIVLAAHLVSSPEYRTRALTRADAEPSPTDLDPGGILARPTFGVSGDGNTAVHLDPGYFSLPLNATDRGSGLVERLVPSLAMGGGIFPSARVSQPSLSDDGRHVVIADSVSDIYGAVGTGHLIDRLAGTRTALDPSAAPATIFEPAISPDGTTVAYRQRSGATDVVVVRPAGSGSPTVIADGNGDSADPKISADGRWVVFSSLSSDLVDDDANRVADVFLHDRTTGTTTRLTDGDRHSGQPWISADGATVAFTSLATDLVDGDATDDGPSLDAFVWTRSTGDIVRVSDGQVDVGPPSVSGDGRFVAFRVPAGAPAVWDRTTGTTAVLPAAPGLGEVQVTTDGGHIAGRATGEGNPPLPTWDLTDVDRLLVTPTGLPAAVHAQPYEVDVQVTGGTDPAIVDSRLPRGLALDGATISGTPGFRPGSGVATFVLADEAGHRSLQRRGIDLPAPGTLAPLDSSPELDSLPSLSADGSHVAFARHVGGQDDSDLVVAGPGGTRTTVGHGRSPSISDDGTVVAYITYDPTPGRFDAFVTGPGGTEPILDQGGSDRAVDLSADASTAVVAGTHGTTPTGDPRAGTYHVDLGTGTVTTVTSGYDGSFAVSADGAEVAVVEALPGGTGEQLVLWEAATGTRTIVEGGSGLGIDDVQISADGGTVAYASTSVAGPSIRTWTRSTGVVTVVVAGAPGRWLGNTAMSADGDTILFSTDDLGLLPGPSARGRISDVYRWDRTAGSITWIVAPTNPHEDTNAPTEVAISADGRVAGLRSNGSLRDGVGSGAVIWTDD